MKEKGRTEKRRARGAQHYTSGMKAALVVLQCVCIGVLIVCILTLRYWTDGTYDLSELGRHYEQTDVFLSDVEQAVRSKIRCAQNEALFETDGEEDLTKQIDIRQYASGISDAANRNENTTYLISDLINFYPQTGQLQNVIDEVNSSQNPSEATADNLASKASGLLTVLPVSGKSLAETAKASSSPFTKLVEYYTELCSASRDLYSRYQDYALEHESEGGESHVDAPSNVRYFVENTTAKTSYTNMEAVNCSQAKSIIDSSDDLIWLFEGVRTMDIMVSASEHCMNQEATGRFIDATFAGANERVVIAVVRGYPAGDTIQADYHSYERREPLAIGSLVIAVTVSAALVILFVLSMITAGRTDRSTLAKAGPFDELPTEIAGGICVIIALIVWYLFRAAQRQSFMSPRHYVWQTAGVISEYLVFLSAAASIARRLKRHTLWTNSVLYTVVQVSRSVLATRVSTRKLLTVYAVFIAANFILPNYFESAGGAVVLVMDLALLLYLMREQVGKMSVREGLREISKGKLEYRIDESGLAGDSLEMAKAVNDMADGLQKAVDSMMKSEHLKTELITNVSHDLKTPLTSIISYVDLLKREDTDSAAAREYIAILDRKSQRLKALITDLIDASRISSGNISLDMQVLDLHQMVLMAEGEFEDRLEEKNLTCSFSLPHGELKVRADGQQLFRVLSNLFSNIVKYALPGSEVKIRLERQDGRAVVSFENESRDVLEKSGEELEERFVRGDLSRSSREEGSGLGLSIAKNLTELMEGSFEVVTSEHTFVAKMSFPAQPD